MRVIHPYTGEAITDLRAAYRAALEVQDAVLCWLLRTSATRPEQHAEMDRAGDEHLRTVAHRAGAYLGEAP